jgi:hypothetical protein
MTVRLEFLEDLLALFSLLLLRSLPVPPVTALLSLAAVVITVLLATIITVLLAAVVVSSLLLLGIPLLLLFLVLFLTAFLLRIVLGGFLVSITNKQIFRLLEINSIPAALEAMSLINDKVKPELDCLFFVLN